MRTAILPLASSHVSSEPIVERHRVENLLRWDEIPI